jgi:hypothetical protein
METSTKQDKLIFFGITFATLAALTFIVNYVNPIAGFGLEFVFTLTASLSGVITMLYFRNSKK